MAARTRVGIRELRQNLSVYVQQVMKGTTFEVTDRGTPVAVLGPLPDTTTPMGRLIARGIVRPPAGDLLDRPIPKGRATTDLSDALQEQREDRF